MLCFRRSALRALSLSLSAPADPTLPRVMGLPVQATAEQPPSSASTIALHPTICDALIYLKCNHLFYANIAKLFIQPTHEARGPKGPAR